MDPAVWDRMSAPAQAILRVNNTLAGRILIGPLVGLWSFISGDLRAIRAGDRRALRGWLLHIAPMAAVIWVVALSPMPVWAYLLSVHIAFGILKIRTFLEHRAHVKARGRTVVIEDRGVLAFLFLNNNLHVVHHMHPRWRGIGFRRSTRRGRTITSRGMTGIAIGPMPRSSGGISGAPRILCRTPCGSADRWPLQGVAAIGAHGRLDSCHTGRRRRADDTVRAAEKTVGQRADGDGIDIRALCILGAFGGAGGVCL